MLNHSLIFEPDGEKGAHNSCSHKYDRSFESNSRLTDFNSNRVESRQFENERYQFTNHENYNDCRNKGGWSNSNNRLALSTYTFFIEEAAIENKAKASSIFGQKSSLAFSI